MEYLTVGEFERSMKALREQIAEGFKVTHAKQDKTNGRVLDLETDVTTLKNADQRRNDRARWAAGVASKVIATMITAAIFGAAGWWAMAYAARHAVTP